mmetsp:Transcript_29189/g.77925  ORF Transcript_29189/g.77925 Transcript_29189/m.77925 type:complete len:441 (+) Transcript_29189:362-1684(+)
MADHERRPLATHVAYSGLRVEEVVGRRHQERLVAAQDGGGHVALMEVPQVGSLSAVLGVVPDHVATRASLVVARGVDESWALPPFQRPLRVVAGHALERVDELPRLAALAGPRVDVREHVVFQRDVPDAVVDGGVHVRVHVGLYVAAVLRVHRMHQIPPRRHDLFEVRVVQDVRRPRWVELLRLLARHVGAWAVRAAGADRVLVEFVQPRRAETVLLHHGQAGLRNVGHQVLQPLGVPVDDLEGVVGGVAGALGQRLEEELVGVQDHYRALGDFVGLAVQPVLERPRLVVPGKFRGLRNRGRDVDLEAWEGGFPQVMLPDELVGGAALVRAEHFFNLLVAAHHDTSHVSTLALVPRRVEQHLRLPVLEGVAPRREDDVHVLVRGRAVLGPRLAARLVVRLSGDDKGTRRRQRHEQTSSTPCHVPNTHGCRDTGEACAKMA